MRKPEARTDITFHTTAEAMAAERDDLDRYVDLFGYSPKYGVSGRRIASVEYRPQPYQRVRPLYEVTETL